MRTVMILVAAFFAVLCYENDKKMIFIENEIHNLYKDNFKDYLIKNNDLLLVDCKKLENHLDVRGYEIKVVQEDMLVKIMVGYNFFIKKEKIYSFELVINYA